MKSKIVKLFVLALAVSLLVAFWKLILTPTENSEPKQKQQSKIIYDTLKLGDKANEVIIDERTNCKYVLFNNKTLVPLYNEKGQVEGCGQYE